MSWLTKLWQTHQGWKVRALVAEEKLKRLSWLEERHEIDRDEREKILKQLVDFETTDAKGRSVFGMEQERGRVKELRERMDSGDEMVPDGKGGTNWKNDDGRDKGQWKNLPHKPPRPQRTQVEDLVEKMQERGVKVGEEWAAEKAEMDKLSGSSGADSKDKATNHDNN